MTNFCARHGRRFITTMHRGRQVVACPSCLAIGVAPHYSTPATPPPADADASDSLMGFALGSIFDSASTDIPVADSSPDNSSFDFGGGGGFSGGGGGSDF